MTNTNDDTARISKVAKTAEGNHTVSFGPGAIDGVKQQGGGLSIDKSSWERGGKAIAKLAKAGEPVEALRKFLGFQPFPPTPPKAKAQLARGLDSRSAPHSAKAIYDANGRGTNKADKVQAKGKAKSDVKSAAKAKVEARKAEKQKMKGNRPYKVLIKPADVTAREGTWRRVMIDVVMAHKDTESANAAMLKNREFGSTHKIDFRFMVNNRYIEFTD